MNRPCLFKWFRIATSALCLIVCCLLVGLWISSYWWITSIQRPTATGTMHCVSEEGRLHFFPNRRNTEFQMRNILNIHKSDPEFAKWRWHASTFDLTFTNNRDACYHFPHWSVVAVFAALAAIPWFPWSTRFSLRTLFIVITIIAVILGAVGWFARK